MKQFEIPIVLFLFKRAEKAALIIDQISRVKPQKIYLIGDGPRNDSEKFEVESCRSIVESHIDWDCKILYNYADENRGVFQNIAGGAKWVFEREPMAIFLEDDNYPALSFFSYCEELLEKYEDDTRILWICGTNYLQKYEPEDGSDYVFTKLMLPCGWASWANKFNKFYSGDLSLYRDVIIKGKVQKEYNNKLLYQHDYPSWNRILKSVSDNRMPSSWDYQMAFSLRANNLFGIAPKYNLIRNIGADMSSIHGGTSMDNIMTRRFCEIPIYELMFPLKHPKALLIDEKFERRTEKIIILPLRYRLKGSLVRFIKSILGIEIEESLSQKLRFMKLNS